MKEHFLTILRAQSTTTASFRHATQGLARLLAAEAAARLPLERTKIQTPLSQTVGKRLSERVILVPILRSGLTLLGAFQELFEEAPIGFFGMRRDEKTAIPRLYYVNLPKITSKDWVFLLDPMLATGGSSILALEKLAQEGASLNQTILVSVIAAQEGIDQLHQRFPQTSVITAAVDSTLNDRKFIVPGLGDFGDRYFDTL